MTQTDTKKAKYSIQGQLGKAKHILNTYDGIKTHRDGSPFWDMEIFKNKKKMQKKINELIKLGYKN